MVNLLLAALRRFFSHAALTRRALWLLLLEIELYVATVPPSVSACAVWCFGDASNGRCGYGLRSLGPYSKPAVPVSITAGGANGSAGGYGGAGGRGGLGGRPGAQGTSGTGV